MDWLVFAAPVVLAALGEMIGQRAGLINIGLEGMMLSGAYLALVVTHATGNPWLGFLVGGVAGILIALFQCLFTLRLALDQIVVGTGLNLLMFGLTGALYRSVFGTSGALISVPTLPRLGWLDVGTVLGIGLAFVLSGFIAKLHSGLVLRATGEYPAAVAASGRSVMRIRLSAALFAGLFGGLGGAFLCVGSSGSFAEDMTRGYGFVAIAMVTFGRWSPWGTLAAAMLIGFLDSLQFRFQALGWQAPPQLFLMLPYLVALILLAALGKGTAAPKSLGIAYKE